MRSLKKLVNLTLFLCLATICTFAQSAVLSPLGGGIGPFFNTDGSVASLGKLYTCTAGSSCPGTPQASFTDSTGLTMNSNPIVLNGGGFPQNATGSVVGVWLTSGVSYKICLANSANVIQFCADNVTGLATTQSAANQATTAVAFSPTPTFTSLAQNQLFTMTLTSNVTSSSLVMSGISTPAVVTFELSEDGTGNRTFSWPANFSGATAINLAPNAVTTQVFWWDGTTAFAVGSSFSGGTVNAMPGEVRMYAGSTPPAGWLNCDGSAVSRLTYASLFSVIGTTYGSGDGSSTFNLPDLRGRVAVGAGQGPSLSNRALASKGGEETHLQSLAEMPAHSHGVGSLTETHSWTGGAPQKVSVNTNGVTAGSTNIQASTTNTTDFSASISGSTASVGGGTAFNVMQPFLVVNYICKF